MRFEHPFHGLYSSKCYVLVEGYDGDFGYPYHVCQTLETAKAWVLGEAQLWAIKEANGKNNIVDQSIEWVQHDTDELSLFYTVKVKRKALKPNTIQQSASGLVIVSDSHYEDVIEDISANTITILTVDFGDEQLT